MARKTRNRSKQASRHLYQEQPRLPGWVWGLSGLAAGLFVALLVYLYNPAPSRIATFTKVFRSQESDTAGAAGQSRDNTPTPNDEPAPPRFEFYQLLPNQEVEVLGLESNEEPLPVSRPTTGNTASAEPPQHPVAETTQRGAGDEEASTDYLLQVGSFRKLSDADQLKASLALLGIEASIQDVVLARGETWHRVRIGPFSDRKHLIETRKRLRAHELHAITVKHGG